MLSQCRLQWNIKRVSMTKICILYFKLYFCEVDLFCCYIKSDDIYSLVSIQQYVALSFDWGLTPQSCMHEHNMNMILWNVLYAYTHRGQKSTPVLKYRPWLTSQASYWCNVLGQQLRIPYSSYLCNKSNNLVAQSIDLVSINSTDRP